MSRRYGSEEIGEVRGARAQEGHQRGEATGRHSRARARALLVPVGLFLATGCAATAPSTPAVLTSTTEQTATTDFRVAAYEKFLSAWSALPDDRRMRLLRASVTQGVVFTNPTTPRTGIDDLADHLRDFQTRVPGGSFRLVAMVGWEDNAIATWQFVDTAGNAGFTGYDVLAFDGEHRIKHILLFSNVPKQTLK